MKRAPVPMKMPQAAIVQRTCTVRQMLFSKENQNRVNEMICTVTLCYMPTCPGIPVWHYGPVCCCAVAPLRQSRFGSARDKETIVRSEWYTDASFPHGIVGRNDSNFKSFRRSYDPLSKLMANRSCPPPALVIRLIQIPPNSTSQLRGNKLAPPLRRVNIPQRRNLCFTDRIRHAPRNHSSRLQVTSLLSQLDFNRSLRSADSSQGCEIVVRRAFEQLQPRGGPETMQGVASDYREIPYFAATKRMDARIGFRCCDGRVRDHHSGRFSRQRFSGSQRSYSPRKRAKRTLTLQGVALLAILVLLPGVELGENFVADKIKADSLALV